MSVLNSATDQAPNSSAQIIRRIFLVIVLICVAAVLWFLSEVISGGQTSQSPDGKYLIGVVRRLEPSPSAPYRITMSESESGKHLREFSIQPIDGTPNQTLRGGPRVVRWDDSSIFADLIFDDVMYCRIYVPN